MKKPAAALLQCALTISSVLPGSAYLADQSPISANDRAKKFPLTIVCDSGRVAIKKEKVIAGTQFSAKKAVGPKGLLKNGCNVTLGGVRYAIHGDDFTISGHNAKGEEWTVKLYIFTMAPDPLEVTVYKGDLDANGKEDLVIYRTTGACGKMPPSSHLDSIMFDEQGNPHVWEIAGFFEQSNNGITIEELLQGKDGRAQIISEQCDYRVFPNYDLEPEYWKTVIYDAKNCSWNLEKDYRGFKFPLLRKCPNLIPTKEKLTRLKKPEEYRNFENGSNAADRMVSAKLLEYQYLYSAGAENPQYLKTSEISVTARDDYYDGFVITDNGKRWISYSNDEADALMKAALNAKQQIRYLKSKDKGEMPLYIWLEN